MSKHGFMLIADPPAKSGRKRAPAASAKASAGKFLGFAPEEQAFVDGMAKHRGDFSAAAVVVRSESHRKKS